MIDLQTTARRLTLAAALALAACTDAPAGPPAVETSSGRLIGLDGSAPGSAAFLGVPFAQPPTGPLRWRAARPVAPAEGAFQATRFAPACMQGDHIADWYDGVAQAFGAEGAPANRPDGVSEDCLYLNIWTSDLAADALPVMVWIHGGSFKGGWWERGAEPL